MDIEDPLSQQPKEIFCHVTTATDTENVRYVFEDVREYLINDVFKKAGMM